jgi:formate hydrogenlyase subunit 3/multisubunit Na+/H+ antiporter MnhD subunit
MVAMVVIFIAVVGHARHMLLGPAGSPAVERTPRLTLAPLVGGLSLCAAIGVFAWPLTNLLTAAARAVAL